MGVGFYGVAGLIIPGHILQGYLYTDESADVARAPDCVLARKPTRLRSVQCTARHALGQNLGAPRRPTRYIRTPQVDNSVTAVTYPAKPRATELVGAPS
eukprot:jgi/Botrbrau1/12792/Bobra.117_1s0011.1